jgi:PAS domain S-box-containing protein
MVRIVSPPKTSAAVPERSSRNEGFDNDTLRTLELSFKTLFHTSLDPMFLLDGLGSFLHANAPGCALLGPAPADLLGKSLLEFVPPSERTQVSALWEALLIEGQQKAEIQVQSTSGETRELFISARTNIWFGIHLLVARDQTELKLLRAAVGSQPGEAKFTTPQPDPAAQESHLVESMPAP